MNDIKKQDLKFGFSNEERVKPQLDNVFGELINNNVIDKYSKIDFQNNIILCFLMKVKLKKVSNM